MDNAERREVPAPAASGEAGREQEPRKENEPSKEAPKPAEPVSASPAEKPLASPPPAAPKTAAVPTPTKDQYLMIVERLLESGLLETYLKLPPAVRERFKAEGERTAKKLRDLIDKRRVRPSAVHHPVHRWLRMIPHVNRFFLLQAAKIKTDGVMNIIEDHQRSSLS